MRIFEYKPDLGTLSLGLERFSQNEVVEVAHLSQIASYSYNNTHKQWFLPNFSAIKDYKTEKNYDLAILNPFLGEKISRNGKINFTEADLLDCLAFLEREKPKFAIICVHIDAIPLLNYAKDYVRDGFNQLSKDFVVYKLQQIGYKPHLIAIDEADYGIPTHKEIAMYIATPNNFNLNFPKGLFSKYGRGKYNKYRTIADAIGDLGYLGEWVPYWSNPVNVYQRNIRRGMTKVTWNFQKRKLSADQKSTIEKIIQGTGARQNENVKQSSGYIRPKWNRICPRLDKNFYRLSSNGPSIHPIKNRPFTIREGMRIMGLPDNISFELTAKNHEVAKLVVDSIAPSIGEIVAIALKAIA